jgi:general secretion pathway protein G
VRRFAKALLWILPAGAFLWFALSSFILEDSSSARKAAANSQLQVCLGALKAYKHDVGEYPTTEQGLEALRSNPGTPNWNGPYLTREVPADPWGHPYLYRRLADGNAEILSLGPEGKPGVSNLTARTFL